MSQAISETFVEIRAELDGLRSDLAKANGMIGSQLGKGVKFGKMTAIFSGITAGLTGVLVGIKVVMGAAKLIAAPFKAAFWAIKKTAQVVIGTIKKIFSGLIGIASRVGAAIKSAFVAGKQYIKGAIDVAKSFSEQMTAVGALTSTIGTKDFGVLREKALELGMSTEFSATQAAMAMANFARTGQDANQILEVMAPTLDFATANFLDLNEASDIAARVMGGMGLSAEEAGRAMDALTIGANKSNQQVGDLAEALKNVGPSARSAGMEIEDAVAVLMSFAEAGRRGGEAGTALKQILLKLPSKTALKLFKELEISAKDATTGGLRPIEDILDDLNRTMGDMDGFDKMQKTISAMGQRAGPALDLLMTAGGDSIRKFSKIIEENAGMAERNAEIQRGSFANSFKIVASAADDLRIRLIDVLEPLIVGANERAVQALNFLSGFVKTKGPEIRDSLVAAFRQAKDWIIEALTLTVGYVSLSVDKIANKWQKIKESFLSVASSISGAASSFFGQDLVKANTGPIERVVLAFKVGMVNIESAFLDTVLSIEDAILRITGVGSLLLNVLPGGSQTAGAIQRAIGGERGRIGERRTEIEGRRRRIIFDAQAAANKMAGASGQDMTTTARAAGTAILSGLKDWWSKTATELTTTPTVLSFGEMGKGMLEMLKSVLPKATGMISKDVGSALGGTARGGQASGVAGTISTVFGSFKVSGDEQVIVLKEIAKSNEIIAKQAGGVVVKAFA